MPRLPDGPGRSTAQRSWMRQLSRKVMRSQKFHLPQNYHLPLRLRPWFLLFTALVMVVLGLLGFTNISNHVPVNDKVMHFVCLGFATGLVYFIFDVEEDARRVWIWRNAGLLITAFVCFLLGGIASEFVQSLLPYKTFQLGDIIANLLGSSLGLYVAYHLERQYRHRREISRLYQPLDIVGDDASEEGDDTLPVYYSREQTRISGTGATADVRRNRLADVWDEGEEVFGIGDDDEDAEVSGKTAQVRGDGAKPL